MKSNLPKEKLNPHKLSFLHNDPNKSYIMKPPMKNLKAFIVPHAGLIYSGDIANEGYAYVDWLKYNRIVILSTHHDSGTFIPISKEFRWKGKTYNFNYDGLIGKIPQSNFAFDNEHSWLVQIPFLKKRNNLTIILVNEYTELMFQSILNIIEKDTLVIANTDLLHCGKAYNNRCPADIKSFNLNTIRKIVEGQPPLYPKELCGKNVIEMFQRLVYIKMWDYHSHHYISSDLIVPSEQSVGYATILYTYFPLEELVRIPRQIMESEIVQSLLGTKISQRKLTSVLSNLENIFPTLNDIYNYEFGIFVTIEDGDRLRGCIGTFLQTQQLFRCIAEMTLKSAFFDSRFYRDRINRNELPKLSYKVNFIGKPFTIFSIKDEESPIQYVELFSRVKSSLKVGLHGITIIFANGRSSTYLANVLVDYFMIKRLTERKWNELKISMEEKANSVGQMIERIELYQCQEYDENYIRIDR